MVFNVFPDKLAKSLVTDLVDAMETFFDCFENPVEAGAKKNPH